MSDGVKHWLREQLLGLMNVQRVSFAPTMGLNHEAARLPDVAVQTWSGALIQIHLLAEALKIQRARRILEHATSVGIITLFMFEQGQLPQHGERVSPDKWFVPFQALNNQWLYVYGEQKTGVVLRQAYFQEISRLECEIRFGEPVYIHQIRHFRSHVTHPALKGNWLIADFETEASAKSPAFRAPRQTWYPPPGERPPRPKPTEPPPRQQSAPPPPPKQPAKPLTKREAAYALLGLLPNADRESVKGAFRKLALTLHPDVSDLPKAEAEARFKALSEAYKLIKTTWDER